MDDHVAAGLHRGTQLVAFGATRFDPRSDRWVRITLFQGAPFPDELAAEGAERWIYGE